MKKLIYLLMLLGAAVNVSAQDKIVRKSGDTINCKVVEVGLKVVKYHKAANLNGPTFYVNKDKLDYILYENGMKDELINSINGHEYVDLGLPSGNLWATCNVGATKPEAYGDYFAWGETNTKEDYSWSTYKWCNGTDKMQTKYNSNATYGMVDSLKVLDAADDAAAVNWGGMWKMPAKIDLMEMTDGCKWKWTENYKGTGVAGHIGTSKTNGNTIFIPAAGNREGKSLHSVGDFDDYWTSSLSEYQPNFAYSLKFGSDDVSFEDDSRYAGRTVRAVAKK